MHWLYACVCVSVCSQCSVCISQLDRNGTRLFFFFLSFILLLRKNSRSRKTPSFFFFFLFVAKNVTVGAQGNRYVYSLSSPPPSCPFQSCEQRTRWRWLSDDRLTLSFSHSLLLFVRPVPRESSRVCALITTDRPLPWLPSPFLPFGLLLAVVDGAGFYYIALLLLFWRRRRDLFCCCLRSQTLFFSLLLLRRALADPHWTQVEQRAHKKTNRRWWCALVRSLANFSSSYFTRQ